MYSHKLPLPVQGSSPHVIHCSSGQALSPLIVPNGMSIRSAVFVWVPNAMLYNELSMGKKTFPVIGDAAYHHRGLSHSHRQHQKNLEKITCGVLDISCQTDKQTDTQTETCTHQQYFATALVGEVITKANIHQLTKRHYNTK